MTLLLKYGWHFLLAAVIGETLVPFILAQFYKGYSHTTMAISALGNGPISLPFNLWMLLAGILFLASTPSIYDAYRTVSRPLCIAVVLCLAAFAAGACILSCFFPAGESKDIVTTASKIHGAGSAIGFMLLLLAPLFLSILSFKAGDRASGIMAAASFILATICFVLFIMADKPGFQNTVIAKEGLWQRLNLLFMYLPLAHLAVVNISR